MIGVVQDEVSGDFQEELVAHMARATHGPENASASSALASFATDAGFLGPHPENGEGELRRTHPPQVPTRLRCCDHNLRGVL